MAMILICLSIESFWLHTYDLVVYLIMLNWISCIWITSQHRYICCYISTFSFISITNTLDMRKVPFIKCKHSTKNLHTYLILISRAQLSLQSSRFIEHGFTWSCIFQHLFGHLVWASWSSLSFKNHYWFSVMTPLYLGQSPSETSRRWLPSRIRGYMSLEQSPLPDSHLPPPPSSRHVRGSRFYLAFLQYCSGLPWEATDPQTPTAETASTDRGITTEGSP